jgi:prophage regulatory protein
MAEAVPVGPEEIRQMLGVSRQRAYVLMSRKDFPDPWVVLSMGKVWRSTDVEDYVARRLRRREA